jgi:hypothetical protein
MTGSKLQIAVSICAACANKPLADTEERAVAAAREARDPEVGKMDEGRQKPKLMINCARFSIGCDATDRRTGYGAVTRLQDRSSRAMSDCHVREATRFHSNLSGFARRYATCR